MSRHEEVIGAQAIWFASPQQMQQLNLSIHDLQLVFEETKPFFTALLLTFNEGAVAIVVKDCESYEKAEEMLKMILLNIGVAIIKTVV